MNGFPRFYRTSFSATPRNKNAKMEVKVTDRFGNVYTKVIENK